jgi:hypothetical protein
MYRAISEGRVCHPTRTGLRPGKRASRVLASTWMELDGQ